MQVRVAEKQLYRSKDKKSIIPETCQVNRVKRVIILTAGKRRGKEEGEVEDKKEEKANEEKKKEKEIFQVFFFFLSGSLTSPLKIGKGFITFHWNDSLQFLVFQTSSFSIV